MKKSMMFGIVAAVPAAIGIAAGMAYYGPGSHDDHCGDMEPSPASAVSGIVCPVKGKTIASAEEASGTSVYKGKHYSFCCPGCKPKFDKAPAKYVENSAKGIYDKS
jgi:YHS domain-containing protein